MKREWMSSDIDSEDGGSSSGSAELVDGDGDEWDWDDDNQQPATTRYSMPHSPHSNGIRILSLLSPLVLARGVGCADIRDPVCIQGHFGS